MMRIFLTFTAVLSTLTLAGCATDGSRLIERPDAWRAAMPELEAPAPVANSSCRRYADDSPRRKHGRVEELLDLDRQELGRVDPGADDRGPKPADGEHRSSA
jgi:hypothetical protein